MGYCDLKVFTSLIQDKILDLPDKMQKEVLSKIENIFNSNDIIDDKIGYLNDEEYGNANTDVDKLLSEKRAELAKLRAEAKTPQQMGELKSPNETIEDGSRFTELIAERKQLIEKENTLTSLIKEREEKMGLYKIENYYKEVTDKKLIRMYDERNQVWDRMEAIYKSIEDAIAEYPMGTKFQCGEFLIQRKRAYTDKTGDRNLVFLN